MAATDSTYDNEDGIIIIDDTVDDIEDAPPTLAALVSNHTIPTRDGAKHDHDGKGQISDRAVLANECPDLAIVDIDIEHDLPKNEAVVLRRQFLDALSNIACYQ
jgi:hypothetical protein